MFDTAHLAVSYRSNHWLLDEETIKIEFAARCRFTVFTTHSRVLLQRMLGEANHRRASASDAIEPLSRFQHFRTTDGMDHTIVRLAVVIFLASLSAFTNIKFVLEMRLCDPQFFYKSARCSICQ